MPSCCHTCNHRANAMHAPPSPTPLDITLITLSFSTTISTTGPISTPYVALNHVLNNITDSADSTCHPTTFTTWSPCLTDAKTVIILTTLSETCAASTSTIFEPLLRYLTSPPNVQHVLLDYSIVSFAALQPGAKIPCDIITLSAPNSSIAGAIGKRFGWEPKRCSLAAQLASQSSAGFNTPGDLIRDFWAWAELPMNPVSPSSSLGSEHSPIYETALRSTNSDEKNMALFHGEDDVALGGYMDDETLIMLFQWSSHADAERFKHPLQMTVGQNGESMQRDLWDRHVAHPVRQLEGVGTRVEKFKLDLRGVEDRIEMRKGGAGRERSGSRRLSTMATEIGERVSGLWR